MHKPEISIDFYIQKLENMPEGKTSLEVYIKRLDVICEVIKIALEPGRHTSKRDLRVLYTAAQKVVNAYLQEKENQNDRTDC